MDTTIKKPVSFSGGSTLPSYGSEAYRQAQQGTVPSGFSGVITPENTVSQTPLKLQEPQSSNIANNIIQNATTSSASIKTQTDAQTAKEDEMAKLKAEQETGKADISGVLKELGMQGQNKIAAQEQAGIPQKQKDLDEITSQIEAKQLAATRAIEDLDKTFQGTTAGKQDAIQNIQRNSARELADLSIIQNAKNRNLLTAQSLVNQKIELQTEGLKSRFDALKFFYDENKQELNKQDQRAFEAEIKKADREYTEGKEKAKTLENAKLKYIADAADIGKGNDVLQAIQNATTPEDVIKIAGRNGVVNLDTQLKKLQIEEKRADIEKTKAEAALLVGNSGSKSDNLNSYAMQYSDTGKLPSPAELKQSGLSIGQVTLLAKQSPKPNGALVSTNTGVKSSSLSLAQEEGILAMSEIVRDTLPALQEKFPKLYTGLLGGIGGAIYTTQDRQDYRTFRQEFLNKLLKARSGSTVTPQEYDRYQSLLPGEFNQSFFFGSDGLKKLNSLSTAMKSSLDGALNNQQLSIYGYSKANVNGEPRTIGEILNIGGVKYKVLPDGTLTDII